MDVNVTNCPRKLQDGCLDTFNGVS
eukprot:SAG31_NODE_46286_length_255_cov_0.660256_1_plen_24_part_10